MTESEEKEKLIEACGKAAGTIDFLIQVIAKCANEGSEIARSALKVLSEETKKEGK